MPSPASPSATVRQLVFIDCQVPDRPSLMGGLAADTRACLLDAERDALEQIADGLARHGGAVEAVHIVVHGSPGKLHFASGTVSRASLTRATVVLERIGDALAPDGDLLLWACEAGRGQGETFLDALALAVGVNVAAATHPVGSLAHGGSWDLDAAVGPATTRAPFTVAAQTHYAGLLQAAPVLTNVATTASYTENAAATVLSNALTVSDSDSPNLASATVRISSGFFFGDVLAADVTGTNIVASYNAANGTLTLRGSDTLAHYQQVLRTVAFSSSSNNPTDFSLYPSRTIDWQVNDNAASIVSLQTHVDYPVGTEPNSVAIGDFNGDGRLDLAVANVISNNVSVLLGSGDGTFGAATNFATGNRPVSVAIGDLNGDGKLDLAVANIDSNNVSVLLGSGDGTFGAATNFTVGTDPVSVAIGDLNGDGKLDLAVANFDSLADVNFDSNVSVLLGDGSGTFGPATNFAAGTNPRSVAIGDLDGDGKLDLVVANTGSNDVSVLLGTGSGTFGAATNFPTGTRPISVAIGDLNGDGKLDLAVANNGSDNVSVLLGTGSGTFGAATNRPTEHSPLSVAIGDLNGDGRLDLVVANAASTNGNSVWVLRGAGNGTFPFETVFMAGTTPASVAIGDLNGSGGLDLAVANRDSNNVSVLLNSGTTLSTFQHTAVVIADVNDPLVLGGAGNTVEYIEQAAAIFVDSALTVSDVDSPNLTSATVSISAADFQDGDTLHFTDQNGITGSYDANTGVLTLTGAASPADYETALRSVTFDNLTNDNPTNFGATPSRTIAWVANDGAANSTGATSTINVAAVNDAPAVTTSAGTTAASEQVAIAVDGALTLADTDNTTLISATVSITGGFQSGQDVLAFSNTNGTTFGNIAAGYAAGTGGLTLTSAGATANVAQWQAALRAVTYTDTSDTPNTANRTLSFVVNDGTNNSLAITKTVSVAAVNDAPIITSNGGGNTAVVSIAEDTIAVTTVTATDPDVGQTLSYSIIGGADAGKFSIAGGLYFVTAPNFEAPTDTGANNVYDVIVQASDSHGGIDTQAIAVTVADVFENTAPIITSNGGGATAAVSLAENTTAVGTVTASDPDVGQTPSYSIIGDASKFTIGSTTGALSFVTAPNFEAPTDTGGNNVYDVMVQVSDGQGGIDTQAIAVTVTDVFENTAPIITSNGGGATAAVSLAENTTAVGTVTASDPDVGQTLSYSIIGDASKFTIGSTTGALSFVTAPNFEAPTDTGGNNVYDVMVQVSDGQGGIDTQAIAVTVTDVFENTAPIITSNGGGATAAVSLAENTTAVTTVTAADPDLGQTLSYSISGGADANKFAIGAAGVLSFVTAPNFEAPTETGGNNVYDVTVQVSDGLGGIDSQGIAVSVQNVTEISRAERFFDSATSDHFYTLSVAEADQIRATLPTFHDEGSPWGTPEDGPNTIDVFRFFDTVTGTHFLTSSTVERDFIIAHTPTLHFEGVAFEAYTAPEAGTLTLERFFNTVTGLHHLSASAAETASLHTATAIGAGWVDEGAGFIVHA